MSGMGMKKRVKKSSGVLPADHWSFSDNLPLSHYTITETEGPVFTQPYSLLVPGQASWLPR